MLYVPFQERCSEHDYVSKHAPNQTLLWGIHNAMLSSFLQEDLGRQIKLEVLVVVSSLDVLTAEVLTQTTSVVCLIGASVTLNCKCVPVGQFQML